MDEEKVEMSIPSKYREINLVCLNHSVNIKTTYPEEDLNILLGSGLKVLRELKKINKEVD